MKCLVQINNIKILGSKIKFLNDLQFLNCFISFDFRIKIKIFRLLNMLLLIFFIFFLLLNLIFLKIVTLFDTYVFTAHDNFKVKLNLI